jgi:hypothetical protein
MAEVTDVVDVTRVAIPGFKCFTVVASDTETFTVPGFSEVGSAQITYNADPSTGNPVGYSVSGATLTIDCTGLSDVSLSIWVQGRQ